jgi:phenylacetate-coenzyme A ligase PaaK-like adenylate-forming protein
VFDLLHFALGVQRLTALKRRPPAALAALQERRWRRLLRYARDHSPFYARRLAGLDLDRCRPADVEPLTKAELMAHFDEVVTDRQVTRAGVERFIADPANLARPYLGRYGVCHTSGSQGQPALVVQPRRQMWLGLQAQAARGQPLPGAPGRRLGLKDLPGVLFGRLLRPARLAIVTQKPGFYPSGAAFAYTAAARLPVLQLLRLSVFEPVADLVARLNEFQPEFITGYTSSLEVLAREQVEGRLHLKQTGRLRGLTNTSEPLPASDRAFIEEVFGVHISDCYSMAECMALSSGCPVAEGSHVNSDLALFEVVDDDYRPVPAGTPGTRVLVTNLTNRVEPLIRYVIGDVVTLDPEPCPCGSPFPHIRAVAGRTKERFWIEAGGEYRELPYYLFLAGLHHCTNLAEHQVLQTGHNRFVVRVAPQPGKMVSAEEVRRRVDQSVRTEGLADLLAVDVEVVPEIPPEPGSGKKPRARNLVGPPPPPAAAGPGPLRHLPALLDAAAGARGRMAAVRLRDQGTAGLRPGAGRAGRARHRSNLHLLRPAGAGDLLPGRGPAAPGQPADHRARRAGSGPSPG